MIFDKSTKINRERTSISKNGARKTGHPYAKDVYLTSYTKIVKKISKN